MEQRELDPASVPDDEDWYGNNAAFKCRACGGTFIASGHLNRTGRVCPRCGKATGFVKGGRNSGGRAWVEW
jgi:hypothetical protein